MHANLKMTKNKLLQKKMLNFCIHILKGDRSKPELRHAIKMLKMYAAFIDNDKFLADLERDQKENKGPMNRFLT